MILVEVPLTRQYLGDDALRTDFLCKIGLSQIMVLHQKAQHLDDGSAPLESNQSAASLSTVSG
jgi:hypothetical protein